MGLTDFDRAAPFADHSCQQSKCLAERLKIQPTVAILRIRLDNPRWFTYAYWDGAEHQLKLKEKDG